MFPDVQLPANIKKDKPLRRKLLVERALADLESWRAQAEPGHSEGPVAAAAVL